MEIERNYRMHFSHYFSLIKYNLSNTYLITVYLYDIHIFASCGYKKLIVGSFHYIKRNNRLIIDDDPSRVLGFQVQTIQRLQIVHLVDVYGSCNNG